MAGNKFTGSGYFKLGMMFVLPLTTLILALVHHSELERIMDCDPKKKTCTPIQLPLISTLHGVRSRRLPNHKIATSDATGNEVMDTLDIIDKDTTGLGGLELKLFTKSIAGKPFVLSTDPGFSQYNTKCWVDPPHGLGENAKCLDIRRQTYAAYALNCYKPDTMQVDYTVSPACHCLQNFMIELSGDLNPGEDKNQNKWTGSKENLLFQDIKKSVQYCSTRGESSYTVEYAGTISPHDLAVNGLLFLAWGLFSILTRWATQHEHTKDKLTIKQKIKERNPLGCFTIHTMWTSFAVLSQCCLILIILVYIISEKTFTEEDNGHAIMRVRDNDSTHASTKVSYKMENLQYLDVTELNEDSTDTLLQIVLWVGFLAQVFVLVAWGVCYFMSNKGNDANEKLKWRTYVPVLARVGTDLPCIMGFAFMGLSVMLQNGSTNYSYLEYNLFVIVGICLLQHVSNVTKLFYDAVCRQTKSGVFIGLTEKDVSLDGSKQNSQRDNQQSSVDGRKKITTVLQFFGWIRVWIFLLVTVFCFLLLTGTNELDKSLPIGNFTQSQLFVFVVVLYLSNVTYDIVRELLPVQFEKHDADSARLYIITGYVVYYVINQRLYIDRMNN